MFNPNLDSDRQIVFVFFTFLTLTYLSKHEGSGGIRYPSPNPLPCHFSKFIYHSNSIIDFSSLYHSLVIYPQEFFCRNCQIKVRRLYNFVVNESSPRFNFYKIKPCSIQNSVVWSLRFTLLQLILEK